MSKCYLAGKKVKEISMNQDINQTAVHLASARLAMIDLAHAVPGTTAHGEAVARLFAGFAALDNSGVFRAVDEHTGYEPSEDIVQQAQMNALPRKDPAEWGDLSGYAPLSAAYGNSLFDSHNGSISGPSF